jgi:hypothetical protein
MPLNPDERRQKESVNALLAELRALVLSIHSLETTLSEKLVHKFDSQPQDAAKEHDRPKKQDYVVQPTIRSIVELPPRLIDSYESEQRKTYRLQKRETALGKIGLRIQRRIASFALYTFISVTIYAGITALQWYQALWATKISNRAYLGVKDYKLWQTEPGPEGFNRLVEDEKRGKLGSAPFIEVRLVNTGITPAVNVTGWISVSVVDSLPTKEVPNEPFNKIDYGNPAQSSTVVIKDGLMVFGRGVILTSDQMKTILDGIKFLVAYGRVTYNDTFGKDHATKFCMFYNRRGGDLGFCRYSNLMD